MMGLDEVRVFMMRKGDFFMRQIQTNYAVPVLGAAVLLGIAGYQDVVKNQPADVAANSYQTTVVQGSAAPEVVGMVELTEWAEVSELPEFYEWAEALVSCDYAEWIEDVEVVEEWELEGDLEMVPFTQWLYYIE